MATYLEEYRETSSFMLDLFWHPQFLERGEQNFQTEEVVGIHKVIYDDIGRKNKKKIYRGKDGPKCCKHRTHLRVSFGIFFPAEYFD